MMYYSKIVVVLLGLSFLALGSEMDGSSDSNPEPDPDIAPGTAKSVDETDLGHAATIWRYWRPWKFWKLGRNMLNNGLTHSNTESAWDRRLTRGERSKRKLKNKVYSFRQLLLNMYYVDSQRTITRRDSSLIVSRKHYLGDDRSEYDSYSTVRPTTLPLTSDSVASIATRPKGSIQKELVTMMFESMLDTIVSSWEVIVSQKTEETNIIGKTTSELILTARKKKSVINKGPSSQTSKSKRSKSELPEQQADSMQQIWWSSPDEKAIIKFRNGNVYEGSISMKCMHGDGRFQWADGTVYLGQFKDNQITGKGIIQWKDDTWYEGDFIGNLRHGRGIYVDSRNQRSYAGGWHCATKHGHGQIYYSKTFKNSYDGEWEHNVRHGFGSREYGQESGYKGEWDKYVREGKGLMIWPNHDFYRGEWKNGLMSGYGIYVWNSCFNNSLSLPSISAYRGNWIKGQRDGYGLLNLGLGLGSYYKGEFKNNKKHGIGKFVTNNGLILQGTNLFLDDNIKEITTDDQETSSPEFKRTNIEEPYDFNIYDSTVGLLYHVQDAINNIDKQSEFKMNIVLNFFETNKTLIIDPTLVTSKENKLEDDPYIMNIEELMHFEVSSLRKSLRCYETELKNIYYKYATICNIEEIHFTPVLIRLYLWQFYYDCYVHEKGLTLIDIDKMFHRNPQWLSSSPHNPFEKIYFWQFMHSLISVASRLYAKRELPGPKPDTILASAFRKLMEKDILPNVGNRKGRLVNGYGRFVSLKGLYDVYKSLNEPPRVRDFLCAIRRPSHHMDHPQPPLIDAPDECLSLGRNAFILGDEMTFVSELSDEILRPDCYVETDQCKDLKLFNFGNLSSKAVIDLFANVFPQICEKDKIMDLDVEITFFEFFEAFIVCAEESIKIKDEELLWREKLSESAVFVSAIQSVPKSK